MIVARSPKVEARRATVAAGTNVGCDRSVYGHVVETIFIAVTFIV